MLIIGKFEKLYLFSILLKFKVGRYLTCRLSNVQSNNKHNYNEKKKKKSKFLTKR